ncbi:MAG: hypothetical protein ABR550_09915, partial [Wenzhouxiangellaceae bacterium]
MLIRLAARLAFVALMVLSTFVTAQAQTARFDVLFDLDRDAATGCTLTPTGGVPVAGYERRLGAIVDTSTQTVTTVELASCDGATFGAAVPIGGGFPVALN